MILNLDLGEKVKNKTPREQGDLYEQSVAIRLDGKLVSGSGSTNHNKEDVKLNDWLIQVKSTTQESHSIKLADLEKLKHHALNTARMPAYVVGFLEHGQPKAEWVMIPLGLLQLLHLKVE